PVPRPCAPAVRAVRAGRPDRRLGADRDRPSGRDHRGTGRSPEAGGGTVHRQPAGLAGRAEILRRSGEAARGDGGGAGSRRRGDGHPCGAGGGADGGDRPGFAGGSSGGAGLRARGGVPPALRRTGGGSCGGGAPLRAGAADRHAGAGGEEPGGAGGVCGGGCGGATADGPDGARGRLGGVRAAPGRLTAYGVLALARGIGPCGLAAQDSGRTASGPGVRRAVLVRRLGDRSDWSGSDSHGAWASYLRSRCSLVLACAPRAGAGPRAVVASVVAFLDLREGLALTVPARSCRLGRGKHDRVAVERRQAVGRGGVLPPLRQTIGDARLPCLLTSPSPGRGGYVLTA